MHILNSENITRTDKIISRHIKNIDSSKFVYIGKKNEKKELKLFILDTRKQLEDLYEVKLNKDEIKLLDHYIYQKWLDYSRSPEGQKTARYYYNLHLISQKIAQQNAAILLEFIKEANDSYITSITLETLIDQNNTKLVEALLSNKIIVPKLSHAVIALHQQNISMLEILIENGLDLSTYNYRLLEISIRYAYEDAKMLLISYDMTTEKLIDFAKKEHIHNIEKTSMYQFLEKKELEIELDNQLIIKSTIKMRNKI